MKATLCLNMIVKNESKVIQRCLLSIKPWIDHWIIVDTGSTDDTRDIIRHTLQDLPGELHQEPWINFEHNRNQALFLAFGKADYIFFIDADEEFQGEIPLLTQQYYTVRHCLSSYDFLRIALIRNDKNWRWQGKIHETIFHPERHLLSSEELPHALILCHPSSSFRSLGKNKCMEDALLLEQELSAHPEDERTVFYLAQNYFEAKQYILALQYYKKRLDMGGWEEEIYWSFFRIAVIQEYHCHAPSSTVVDSYLQAFFYRPSRVEALYYLACHYFQQQHYVLNYFLLTFLRTFSDCHDAVCVERWILDWGIEYQLMATNHLLKRYEAAYQLAQGLLQKPSLPKNRKELLSNNLTLLRSQY